MEKKTGKEKIPERLSADLLLLDEKAARRAVQDSIIRFHFICKRHISALD